MNAICLGTMTFGEQGDEAASPRRCTRWILGGVLAGLAGAALVASSMEFISDLASGVGQEIFNALVLTLAIASQEHCECCERRQSRTRGHLLGSGLGRAARGLRDCALPLQPGHSQRTRVPLGYDAQPAGMQIVFYVLVLVSITAGMVGVKNRAVAPKLSPAWP